MLEVKLGNGKILESAIGVRELIQLNEGSPELNITINSYSDIISLYNLIKEENALSVITVSDTSVADQTLVLTGYTKILSLERIFNSKDADMVSDNFRVSIRLVKE